MRQSKLATGECYHIFTKSIANYVIFNGEAEYCRMKKILSLARFVDAKAPLSQLLNLQTPKIRRIRGTLKAEETMVRIIAYAIMPTHLHLILRQQQGHGISGYMNRLLNSYTRFFNLRHGRKGPLWEGRFGRILIENDEHLLHETRYVHLNPVTAYLTEDPADWPYSSYREYLRREEKGEGLCEFKDIVDMKPALYEKFVLADKENQRERAKAKKRGREPGNFNLRG